MSSQKARENKAYTLYVLQLNSFIKSDHRHPYNHHNPPFYHFHSTVTREASAVKFT